MKLHQIADELRNQQLKHESVGGPVEHYNGSLEVARAEMIPDVEVEMYDSRLKN